MAPALELGTIPGHGYSPEAVMMFLGSALQNKDFCEQTPCFLFALAGFTVYTRDRLNLFRGASSFTVFQHFLLTGTSPKSCLGATSVLNDEFFKNGVKFSLTIGCRYINCYFFLIKIHLFQHFTFSNVFGSQRAFCKI